MATFIPSRTRIHAAAPKLIDEFVGRDAAHRDALPEAT
jgi:hypothetical protein